MSDLNKKLQDIGGKKSRLFNEEIKKKPINIVVIIEVLLMIFAIVSSANTEFWIVPIVVLTVILLIQIRKIVNHLTKEKKD